MIGEFPTVSVVIPTYNRAELVRRAIASALAQTLPPHEVIVVDDASTDNTQEVIASIRDSRLRYIRLEANGGGSRARNAGIDAAKSDLIALLDSDDYWLADKLEQQVAVWLECGDRDRAIIYCKLRVEHSGGRQEIIPVRSIEDDESALDYTFGNGGIIQSSAILAPTVFLRAHHFREGLACHQDNELVWRMQRSGGHFRMVPQALTVWNNDFLLARISSRRRSHKPSLEWFREVGKFMSPRTRQRFLVAFVGVPMLRTDSIGSLQYFFDAWRGRALTTREVIVQFIKGVLPDRVYSMLRVCREFILRSIGA